jgi:hypothetical protein
MKKRSFFLWLLFFFAAAASLHAQQKDSSKIRLLGIDSIKAVSVSDTTHKKHSPRKAAIRSAIIPGWGQAYNRKYWKIPLVYTALGINAAVFNYNLKEYRKIRFAYQTLVNNDTANFKNVAQELQPFLSTGDTYSLKNYRAEFRKNIDYSVLFFLLFWGLNVVDATVDAHLKEFDISDQLTMKIKPNFIAMPNTVGLSFVFTIGKNHPNRITSLR